MTLGFLRKTRPAVFLFSVFIGVILPFSTVFIEYKNTGKSDLLTSFFIRLTDTWPNFINLIKDLNGDILGLGFGTIGSPFSSFPINGLIRNGFATLGVADNSALYLWGVFGVFGVFFYLLQFPLLIRLSKVKYLYQQSLMEICLFICIFSWTTDVFENVICIFFIGSAISVFYKNNVKIKSKISTPKTNLLNI